MPRWSFAAKERLVVAILVVYIAWVPIHRGVVHLLEANPWKLGGFAMYATPAPVVGFRFFRDDGGRLTPLTLQLESRQHRLFLDVFRARRDGGWPVTPEPLARALFAGDPTLDRLAVVVVRNTMPPFEATFRSRRTGYRYTREQLLDDPTDR